MSELAIERGTPREARPGLTCRLRKRTLGRAAASPVAGEVELENTSDALLEIEVQMSPLQFLNLVVTGPAGEVLSEGHYGNRFSPLEQPYTFRLRPGEKYTGPVSLLGTVPEAKRLPGRYLVQAVYAWDGLRAVSEPMQVDLTGQS
jgi:hypothetical protein